MTGMTREGNADDTTDASNSSTINPDASTTDASPNKLLRVDNGNVEQL